MTAEKLMDGVLRCIAGPDGTAEVFGPRLQHRAHYSRELLASCHGDVKVLLLERASLASDREPRISFRAMFAIRAGIIHK